MDPLTEIKQLYYRTTQTTILKDVDRAIDLLKTMKTDDERQRAAVYMDGLAEMRKEWAAAGAGTGKRRRASVLRKT